MDTGKKDKHGNSIFLGDSVKLYFYPNEEIGRNETVTKVFEIKKGSVEADTALGYPTFSMVNGQDIRLLNSHPPYRLERIEPEKPCKTERETLKLK